MQLYGINALVQIISHFVFIFIAFRAVNALNLQTFFKNEYQNTVAIRLFLTLLAIVLGYTASSFFMEFMTLCRNLFVSFS